MECGGLAAAFSIEPQASHWKTPRFHSFGAARATKIPDPQPSRYSIIGETTTNFRVWSLSTPFGRMGVRLPSSAIRRGRARPNDPIPSGGRLLSFSFSFAYLGSPIERHRQTPRSSILSELVTAHHLLKSCMRAPSGHGFQPCR